MIDMATSSVTATISTIRVDRREKRSAPNAALQTLLRPVGRKVAKPSEPGPDGSPKLTPHKKVEQKCEVKESQIADTWIYTLSPGGDSGDSGSSRSFAHKLYYFAGGGFRDVPSKEHWLLLAEMACQLAEYEVVVVSYPLAPKCKAPISIPHMEKFYQAIVADSRAQDFRITLMGDSSGGNIALVLGLYGASEFLQESAEKTNAVCPVETVFAMSPAVDLRNLNPDIGVVDQHDPLLCRDTIEEVAKEWQGEWDLIDPRISPALADLSLFQRAGIKVDGLTGGHDVLTPDALVFRNKLAESRVEGDWLQWEKQVHCFPLTFSHHLSEGIAGKDWILEVLKANSQRTSPSLQ